MFYPQHIHHAQLIYFLTTPSHEQGEGQKIVKLLSSPHPTTSSGHRQGLAKELLDEEIICFEP